ncbi:hypothetical protein ART_0852 [Arthrobacter sp. PAMC 25486]|nr:hypothetical protein ART_0852 [Arthrobacter sp. PAMC 25486]
MRRFLLRATTREPGSAKASTRTWQLPQHGDAEGPPWPRWPVRPLGQMSPAGA